MEKNLKCLLSTVESDSHMWNLVYMQLFMEEQGMTVDNLGCCVPAQNVVSEMARQQPDMVVVSSVNGHGYFQGMELMQTIKNTGVQGNARVVIGGKLSILESENEVISEQLQQQGYDGVFVGANAIREFVAFIKQCRAQLRFKPVFNVA